ncbi:hypothetical protein [Ktedonospora formicarum]|uniref:Uncharacterized protein n=1 Tax=Ktedonospora formicarum TaxID=2778364 RepID=A0A8J3N061_9CHLR|nr:hypothetical protein [Ktedonospora formicarum]GHO51156.1 hypothetical protein KSX_93190 [Ktedonospora formicarum]GHO51485.1 hypothetical protein KSX_96480 [Ktedonospora formicarum]
MQLDPYVRYRWREDTHTYTISLGFLNDSSPFPFTPQGFSRMPEHARTGALETSSGTLVFKVRATVDTTGALG